jgi:hypothetical protein
MSDAAASDPRMDHPRFFCADCDVDTYVNEQFYMLHNELWAQVAADVDTMLCLDCFEKRLGRPLRAVDFAQVPLNEQQARMCPALSSTVKTLMTKLVDVAPAFAEEVRALLVAAGRSDLAEQSATVSVLRCTRGDDDSVAYIYCVRPLPSSHLSKLTASVAKTLSFYAEVGINVDVDHDGHLLGIELLDREDVVASLRAANAL